MFRKSRLDGAVVGVLAIVSLGATPVAAENVQTLTFRSTANGPTVVLWRRLEAAFGRRLRVLLRPKDIS